MKITGIATHEICPPFHEWNSEVITRYQGPEFRCRTVYVFRSDNGLEGLGERGGRQTPSDDEWISRLEGTNPAEWLAHPELPVWLACGIYDLVAKFNDIPVYRLFGPRVEGWHVAGSGLLAERVPISAWAVSQTPEKMAEEVVHAVESGHTWLKYHTNHFHNIVAQTEAMQAVAPQGFKVHYDLNFDSTVEHILNLGRQLERYPIAGAFEDPVRNEDFAGYRELRSRSPIPIYFHHLPLQGREATMGLADGYLMGHTPVGNAIRRAGLFEASNIPFMLQNTGGNITRAFVAHMATAFPGATLHHVTATDLWAEDVVSPPFSVSGGTIAVSEEPGLGLTLDRGALARWEGVEPPELPRALVRILYRGMSPIYGRLPVNSLRDRSGVAPAHLGAFGGGYDQPVDMDFWNDDGTAEFARLWDLTASGLAG
jgi:L-alanine-DL-glutamate epimerase-like enolase superfamily enzyme